MCSTLLAFVFLAREEKVPLVRVASPRVSVDDEITTMLGSSGDVQVEVVKLDPGQVPGH